MKIFVDDLREPPDTDWIICRNSDSAMEILLHLYDINTPMLLEEISLDHDLGGDDNTRYIVNFFCETAWWPQIYVHTANFLGRDWLEGTILRYAPEGTLKKGY